MMACSSPADCAEIERRHSTGVGLLADGGASRGNLLSGEADEVILTVSRMEAEKRANPGYRAFLANGFNVTRALVLFVWEVRARVDRGAPRQRAATSARAAIAAASTRSCAGAMCVIVRDLVVFGVLTDMMRGRPAVYATFVELRRGRPPLRARARRHARGAAQARPAVRPHRARAPLRAAPVRDRRPVRPRADAGRDVQAAQRLRPRRARRALARAARASPRSRAATSRRRWSDTRSSEATGGPEREAGRRTTSPIATSWCSARATSGSIYLWRSRAG